MAKANYDLPTDTLEKVVKLSKSKTKREAIVIALESYIRKKKLERLMGAYGKVTLSWTSKSLEKFRE